MKRIFVWDYKQDQYVRKDSTCPKCWKAQYIDGMRTKESKSQAMGVYLEHIIGVNPDARITDLPRKAKGIKTADHYRIDRQADMFRGVVAKYGLKLDNVQVSLTVPWIKGRVELNGTLDILDIIENMAHNVDVKVCANVTSDFGEFQWAEPEKKDYMQAKMYDYLFYRKFKKHMKHVFLVFDYSPQMNHKEIIYDIGENDHEQIEYLIESTLSILIDWHHDGYPTVPSVDDCRYCPFGSREMNAYEKKIHEGFEFFGDRSCEDFISKAE